jgi:hypothetical protein
MDNAAKILDTDLGESSNSVAPPSQRVWSMTAHVRCRNVVSYARNIPRSNCSGRVTGRHFLPAKDFGSLLQASPSTTRLAPWHGAEAKVSTSNTFYFR